jgi:hypothetical protein
MHFVSLRQRSLSRGVLFSSLLLLAANYTLFAYQNPAAEARKVPVIDAGIGSCSVEFTVNDPDGKPVYDAKIRVHIAYGFMNLRKIDLEQGTNIDGKARFTGLPNKVKQPLEFTATKNNLLGSAVYDPANSCKAAHAITLENRQ